GVGGGVFSALFGTGGPVYTTYLARRIEGPTFRATISSIILMSGVIRRVTFGTTGLLQQPGLLTQWLWMLPVCAVGVFVGSKLHARLPPLRVRQALFVLLAVSGAGVIVRALA
ncbi:MAG TPA: TSUP family transporter, partial [Ramlibacter sp.]